MLIPSILSKVSWDMDACWCVCMYIADRFHVVSQHMYACMYVCILTFFTFTLTSYAVGVCFFCVQ